MSWIKYAKPGDRVVCIKDDWSDFILTNDEGGYTEQYNRIPMINEVLTVSDIQHGIKAEHADCIWIEFSEIDGLWSWEYFSPLFCRPPDISIFTEMLNKAPAKTLEEV